MNKDEIFEKLQAVCVTIAFIFSLTVPFIFSEQYSWSENIYADIFGFIVMIIVVTITLGALLNYFVWICVLGFEWLFKKVLKKIFYMCKNNVFFTVTFLTNLFLLVFSIMLLMGNVDVEEYESYTPIFVLLKWAVFLSSALIAFDFYKKNKRSNGIFIFGALAVLFNTFLKVPFDNYGWYNSIFVALLIFSIYSVLKIRKGE